MKQLTSNQIILDNLEKKGITEPTPVQKQVIPEVKLGKNILFQSETGTGKTFAYLIPLLENISPSENKVQLVITAPTHELASQIKAEVQAISDIKVALLIGGAPIKRQQELLKEKPLVVIGGPSRLLELINLKKLKVDNVKSIVLDEVDRLLSPELRDETTDLVSSMPKTAQLVACSATTKASIARILEDALAERKSQTATTKNDVEAEKSAETSSGDESNNTIEKIELPMEDVLKRKITHWAFFVEQRKKIEFLRKLLAAEKPTKALVFTSRADQVENIASKLRFAKVECTALHAKTDKVERKQAIDRFRSGKNKILITSDLTSRGLDFADVSHIIQMDVSTNDDFFIHRAGRTARAGKTGINIVIGDAHEMRLFAKLEKKLGFVVYPKELHNGKVTEPYIDEEN